MNINQHLTLSEYKYESYKTSVQSKFKSFGSKKQISITNQLDISDNYKNDDPNIYMLLPPELEKMAKPQIPSSNFCPTNSLQQPSSSEFLPKHYMN